MNNLNDYNKNPEINIIQTVPAENTEEGKII